MGRRCRDSVVVVAAVEDVGRKLGVEVDDAAGAVDDDEIQLAGVG
jgi:hypothetical protein